MKRAVALSLGILVVMTACGPQDFGTPEVKRQVKTKSASVVTTLADTLVPTEVGPNGWAVGPSKGIATVSPEGAAMYTVPLWVPAGRAGVQPALALAYKSGGGSNILGDGWSLAGLSAISRCPRTHAQDGRVEIISFTSSDAFCLDGQRLVAVQGVYGASGTEYRAERDGFAKIVSLEVDAQGPAVFKVYLKDGRILTYGKLNNSTLGGERINYRPQSATGFAVSTDGKENRLAWSIAQVEDRSGNFMSFRYAMSIGSLDGSYEQTLSRIEYTGSSLGAGTAANRFVEFDYLPRPDPRIHHVNGFMTKASQRLKEIRVLGPKPSATGLIRSYRMAYVPDTQSSVTLLASVQECDGEEVCLPPISFSWTPESDSFEDVDTGIADVLSPSGSASIFRTLNPIDIDGDGFDDLLYRATSSEASRYKWVIRYGSASGYGTPVDAVSLPSACWDVSGGHNGRWADVNMDGLPDVSLLQWNACSGPGQYNELKHFRRTNLPGGRTANSFQQVENDGRGGDAFWYADLNGDAYPELVRVLDSTRTLGFRSNVGGALQPFQPIVTSDLNDNNQFVVNLDGSPKTSLLFTEMRRRPGPFDTYEDVGKRYWSMTQRPDGSFGKQETTLVRSDVDLLPDGTPFDYGPEGEAVCNNCYRWQYIFADLTGDGLPDAIRAKEKSGGDIQVLVNTGDGFASPVNVALPTGYQLAPFNKDNGIRVLDFDRDGRQDLLLVDDGGQWGARKKVVLLQSRGTQFTARRLEIPVGEQGTQGYNLSQLLDANGDGLTDLAQIVNGTVHVYLRKGQPSGLLKSVVDGLGSSTEFDYKPMIDPSVYTPGTTCTYPQVCVKKGQWLVSDLRTDTGSTVMRGTRYSYVDGRMDVSGRGWLGFSRMTARDLATGVESRVDYDNHTREGAFYPLAGLPTFESITTPWNGRLHIQVRSTQYRISSQGTPRVNARLVVQPLGTIEEVYDRLETDAYNAGLFNRVASQFTFEDTYGNLLSRSLEFLNGDRMEWVTDYQNDPTSWLVGLPIQERQTSTVRGTSQVRLFTYEYTLGTALLKKQVAEPNDPQLAVVTEQFRDSDGLMNELRTTGVGMASRSTYFTYDPLDRVHPASVVNSLGHTIVYTYHPSLGVPASAVDANGVVTRWQYDGFGRVRKLDNPDSSDVTLSYVACADEPGCAFQVRTQAVQGQDERTSLDRLGRTVSVSKRAFNEADGWITSRWEFDPLGRVARNWNPSPTGFGQVSTSFTYDTLGRPLVTTYPDGTTVSRQYLANQVKSYDEKNNLQVTWLDGYGRTSSVDDYVDGRKLTTSFQYGPFGTALGLISPTGDGPAFKYDRQGRRIEVNDPDSGLTLFKYNALGEVIEEKDANGDTTLYERDLLGRVIQATNRDGVSTYLWDDILATGGGIGKLHKRTKTAPVGSSQGVLSTEYSYDALGRPVEELWTINGSQYSVGREYDAYNRLSRLKYPQVGTSNFAVDYEYTTRGQLKQVRAANNGPIYWSVDGRNGLQQLTQESFGNGVASQRRYDTRGRLLFIQSSRAGQDLQKLAYEYELNGNVRSRHDRHDPLRMSTEDFTYDSLDRLKSWAVFQNCQSGTATYQYDDRGNLLSRQGLGENLSAFYERTGGAGPHAVTRSNLGVYSYDENGNQLTAPGRSMTYTVGGLPSRIVTSKGDVEYSYDSTNVRTVKRASSGEATVYVGGLFEERKDPNGVVTRVFNIQNDVGTVAQITWGTDTSGASILLRTNYLHTDALGSVTTLSDESGGVTEQMRYDPFGGRRLAQSLARPVTRGTGGVRQGFTGHEHDDEFGLINMQGRIYDPSLGRFLSPDEFVAGRAPSQALNRYSYVLNNPLRYKDPSGWLPRELPVIVYDAWFGGYAPTAGSLWRIPNSSSCSAPTKGADGKLEGGCDEVMTGTLPAAMIMSSEFYRFVWSSFLSEGRTRNFGYGSGFFMGVLTGVVPFASLKGPPSGNSAEFYTGYSDALLLVGSVEIGAGLVGLLVGSGVGGVSVAALASGGAAPLGAVGAGVSVGVLAVSTTAVATGVVNIVASSNALQMANQSGSGGGDSAPPEPDPSTSKKRVEPSEVNSQNVLEGMSKNNLKHSAKHLAEFQALDSSITADKVREIGASIVRPENLISAPGATQLSFQAAVEIGGQQVTVRTVLNELGKLHSVHIRR